MKTLFAIVTVVLAVACAVLLTTVLIESSENRELRQENQKLLTDLHAAATKARTLEDAGAEATAKLAAKQDELRALGSKLEKAEAEAQSAKTNWATAAGAALRSQQLRAFVGTKFVGRAWIVPSNATKDPQTGLINFEPVVVLEEASKRAFTVQETNFVERDVARYSAVNYNYSPYPYYWYYYPFVTVGPTNAVPPTPPQNPSGASPPSKPGTVRPMVSGGGAWTPYMIQSAPAATPMQVSPSRNFAPFARPAPVALPARAAGTLPPLTFRR